MVNNEGEDSRNNRIRFENNLHNLAAKNISVKETINHITEQI